MQGFDPFMQGLTIFLLFLSEINVTFSSGSGKAPQTCGTDNSAFYCQYRQPMCQPRSLRCTESNVCLNPNTNLEEGCKRDPENGGYAVYLGRSPISSSSSSSEQGILGIFNNLFNIFDKNEIEHRFITYRGFTYEFGKGYGVQILDINDPQYKYKDGKDVKGPLEYQGPSQCTWENATEFCDMFDTRYRLRKNNCKHFAEKLTKTLLKGPCATSKRKRSEQISLEEYIRQLLQNDSCSDTNTTDSSSSYPQVHASVLSKFILVLLAILVVSILMLQ